MIMHDTSMIIPWLFVWAHSPSSKKRDARVRNIKAELVFVFCSLHLCWLFLIPKKLSSTQWSLNNSISVTPPLRSSRAGAVCRPQRYRIWWSTWQVFYRFVLLCGICFWKILPCHDDCLQCLQHEVKEEEALVVACSFHDNACTMWSPWGGTTAKQKLIIMCGWRRPTCRFARWRLHNFKCTQHVCSNPTIQDVTKECATCNVTCFTTLLKGSVLAQHKRSLQANQRSQRCAHVGKTQRASAGAQRNSAVRHKSAARSALTRSVMRS